VAEDFLSPKLTVSNREGDFDTLSSCQAFSHHSCQGDGSVYRCGQGAAVEFTEISPDNRHTLLRLIHQKSGDRRILRRAPLATQVESEQCMSLAFSRDVSLAACSSKL